MRRQRRAPRPPAETVLAWHASSPYESSRCRPDNGVSAVSEEAVVTVKELMRTRNLVTVGPDDDLTVAGQILRWADVRHLPVVEGARVVGVLSEHDLLRQGAGAQRERGTLVRNFMSSPAEVISPDDEVALACAVMVA